MRIRGVTATVLLVLTASVGAIWITAPTEILRVRAIDRVTLFDPNSLATYDGSGLRAVGQLNPGQELEVLACADRKSDINVYALYQGREVAVGEWQARVELHRRRALPWEKGATASCHGFFRSISRDA